MKNEVCLIEIKKKGLKVVILVVCHLLWWWGVVVVVLVVPTVTVAHLGIEALLIKF